MTKKRKVLTSLALLAILIVFLAWPRPLVPPLAGLGEPVLEKAGDATYTFPGDYPAFVKKADRELVAKGYTALTSIDTTFTHPNGSLVALYPGRWQKGSVDMRVQGWVTVVYEPPQDPLRRFLGKVSGWLHRH